MKFIKQSHISLIFFLACLTGCAVQLAPKYDAALFEGVIDTNVKIMALLATVSTGTDSSTFSQRAARYNGIIGAVDALTIQSKARPVPETAITDKVNVFLASRGLNAMDGTAASASSLAAVSSLLTKMKALDSESGLTLGAIAVFRSGIIISMDQAITYESFLNR
jgi:hypothetical protein